MNIDVREVTRDIERFYIETNQQFKSEECSLSEFEKAEIKGRLSVLNELHAHYLQMFYDEKEIMMKKVIDLVKECKY